MTPAHRFRRLFRIPAAGPDEAPLALNAELRFHWEMRVEQLTASGKTRVEAEALATREISGLTATGSVLHHLAARNHRTERRRGMRDDLAQDSRHGIRLLRRHPGFTVVAALILALGIGANAAVFSIVRATLFAPLPYSNGDRVVQLHVTGSQCPSSCFSVPEVLDIRSRSRTLEGVAEYHYNFFDVRDAGETQSAATGIVSANFFDVLGVRPMLGRGFLPGDDDPRAAAVMVISHEYWQRRLHGDAAAVGRVVLMNGRAHTIVGVLPVLPPFPDRVDVYTTTAVSPFRSSPEWTQNRRFRAVTIFGLLRSGASPRAVQADLRSVAKGMVQSEAQAYQDMGRYGIVAHALRDDLVAEGRRVFLLIFAVTSFLFLIACANVGNLTLARLRNRHRELSVRVSLGASRWRIVRQLIVENILLSGLGAIAGVALAYGTRGLLRAFAARYTPLAVGFDLDLSTLLLAAALGIAAGVIIGVFPLIVRQDLLATRPSSGAAANASRRQGLADRLLVSFQVATSVVLLVGAGLLVRSLVRLTRVDAGYDASHVVTLELSGDYTRRGEGPRKTRAVFDPLAERIRALPGIHSAAYSMNAPLGGVGPLKDRFGAQDARNSPAVEADLQAVSTGYFKTLGIRILAGRDFTSSDNAGSGPVAIINQSMARRLWGTIDPVGRRLTGGMMEASEVEVIGVAADVRHYALDAPAINEVYRPFAQLPIASAAFSVRSMKDAGAIAAAVRAAVKQIAPDQAVGDAQTLAELRGNYLSKPRLTTVLVSLFAVLALAIAIIGVGGSIALSVSERTREFAIRAAIGASDRQIVVMILKEGYRTIGAGLAMGVTGAVAATRLMQSLLFGTSALDPLSFAVAVTLLAITGGIACTTPALRAARANPVSALRGD